MSQTWEEYRKAMKKWRNNNGKNKQEDE